MKLKQKFQLSNCIKKGLVEVRIKVLVRSFSGTATEDMKDYVKPIMKKKPKKVIIHIGTMMTLGVVNHLK